MSWSQTLLLVGICLVIAGAIAVLAIRGNPRCVEAIERLRQRRILRRLKRRLPKQPKKEKERLCALWSGNPAAQCATIFNRFNRPPKKVSLQELADDTDHAITAASSLFEEDAMSRYAELYGNRIVVRTTEIAEELAAQYPEQAALILQTLRQNDTEISRCFNESIRDALSQGERDRQLIRAHLHQLEAHSDRFRRLLTSQVFSKIQRHFARRWSRRCSPRVRAWLVPRHQRRAVRCAMVGQFQKQG